MNSSLCVGGPEGGPEVGTFYDFFPEGTIVPVHEEECCRSV